MPLRVENTLCASLPIRLVPSTALRPWYTHREWNIPSFFLALGFVYSFLSAPGLGATSDYFVFSFLFFPKAVNSNIAYIIHSLQDTLKAIVISLFLNIEISPLPKTTVTQLLACLKWFLYFSVASLYDGYRLIVGFLEV